MGVGVGWMMRKRGRRKRKGEVGWMGGGERCRSSIVFNQCKGGVGNEEVKWKSVSCACNNKK
jgi:hypothetical protein